MTTSATSGPNAESCSKPSVATAQTPVLQVACRMLRSPSHESVTTDLSLFSVSSIASDAAAAAAAAGGNSSSSGASNRLRLVTFKSYSEAHLTARGPSPNPENKTLTVGGR